ncbi:MAG: hypothetical protein ACRCWG_09970 [Sarcina sp.]
MKISEKEKIMLGFLLVGAIGVGYYHLGYKPKAAEIKKQQLELDGENAKYTKAQSEIASMEKNQKTVDLLNFSIEDANKKIYPDIWQPKLIKELKELRTKAGIDIKFQYSPVTYAPISEYFTSKEEEQDMTNTLNELLEEYNKEMPADKKVDYKRVNGEPVVAREEKAKEEKSEGTSINVQQMKVSASFTGEHDNIMKFIKLVEDYKYLVAIPNISLTPSGNGKLSGSLNMEFYSAPRLNGDFDNYYDLKLDSKTGKDNMFEDTHTSIDSIENEDSEAVSMEMVIRPFNSDMPSITIGRPNDAAGRTKLRSEENGVEEVTIEFYQEGDQYLVKYKMGSQIYPKSGGIEFVPKGNVKVSVASEKRVSGQDMVKVKLNVKNTTDKRVEVDVTGDDKENPRVDIKDEGDVYFTRR